MGQRQSSQPSASTNEESKEEEKISSDTRITSFRDAAVTDTENAEEEARRRRAEERERSIHVQVEARLKSLATDEGELLNLANLGIKDKLASDTSALLSTVNTNRKGNLYKILLLSDNSYESFPPLELQGRGKDFAELRRLDLSYNQFYDATSVRLWPSLRETLRVLDLSHNLLTWVPEDVMELCCLETLTLSNNKINTLPTTHLYALSRTLTSLNLSDNLLTSLPPQFSSLSNLQHLLLFRNRLSHLPQELSHLTSLLTLHLAYNDLTRFPIEVLRTMTQLRTLYLHKNPITHIPATDLCRLSSLADLSLAHTKIEDLPREISYLTSLTHLDVKFCPSLHYLPSELLHIPSLKAIHFERNISEATEFIDVAQHSSADYFRTLVDICCSVLMRLNNSGDVDINELGLPEELIEKLLTGGRKCFQCGQQFFGQPSAEGRKRKESGPFTEKTTTNMTLTGNSVASDTGQDEVPVLLDEDPTPFGLSDAERILGSMFINIPCHLVATKIASSPLAKSLDHTPQFPRAWEIVKGSPGPLFAATCVCWVTMFGTIQAIAHTREITEQDVHEVTKPYVLSMSKFDMYNYACAGIWTSLAFPFVAFLPVIMISDHGWQGWPAFWEKSKVIMKRHYPTIMGLNLIRMCDNPLRTWLEEMIFNLIGRPFEKQEDELSRGARQRFELEFEEDQDGNEGGEKLRVVLNKGIRIGITIGVAACTAILWMPVDVVCAQVVESPYAYESPLACAQRILAVEGWKGLYRATLPFLIGIMPYDTIISILGD